MIMKSGNLILVIIDYSLPAPFTPLLDCGLRYGPDASHATATGTGWPSTRASVNA
jgi:hypothetical protein